MPGLRQSFTLDGVLAYDVWLGEMVGLSCCLWSDGWTCSSIGAVPEYGRPFWGGRCILDGHWHFSATMSIISESVRKPCVNVDCAAARRLSLVSPEYRPLQLANSST